MHIYVPSVDGKEGRYIYNKSVPLECVPEHIKNVLAADAGSNLHKVLIALSECHIDAPAGRIYIAWVTPSHYIEIHLIKEMVNYPCPLPVGFYLVGFSGDKMPSGSVRDYLKRNIRNEGLGMIELGLEITQQALL